MSESGDITEREGFWREYRKGVITEIKQLFTTGLLIEATVMVLFAIFIFGSILVGIFILSLFL